MILAKDGPILEPLKAFFNLSYEAGTMKLLCCGGRKKKKGI